MINSNRMKYISMNRKSEYIKILIAGLAVWSTLLYSAESKTNTTECVISITANPPLPVENILSDPDFEEKFKNWKKTSEASGRTLITDKDSINEKASLLIIKEKKEDSSGIWQDGKQFKKQFKKGEEYIISCYVKGDNSISDIEGNYTGIGVTLSIFDKTWRKSTRIDARSKGSPDWIKLISKPFTIPDWAENFGFSAEISYTAGKGLISNVFLGKAYSDLRFTIKGGELYQVILEDDKGSLLYDSGELPPNTEEFSKTIKILSPYVYTVRVLDTKGNIYSKIYPDQAILPQK